MSGKMNCEGLKFASLGDVHDLSMENVFPVKSAPTPILPFFLDRIPDDSLASHHLGRRKEFGVSCYFSGDLVVSGSGLLWTGGNKIITDADILPKYWHDRLSGNTHSNAEADQFLPIRVIEEPCICSIGWASGAIYGHFILEMIPRTLLAMHAANLRGIASPKILLRRDSAAWAPKMLEDIGITSDRVVFFSPEAERVRLAQGIFPAYPYQNSFHPEMARLIGGIGPRLSAPYSGKYHGRTIFISRMGVNNPGRSCVNESHLVSIAETEFGADIIYPEQLDWGEQIAIFQDANAVVSLYGSAMHTALLGGPGLKVGVIGLVNYAQTHIAALCGQQMGYLVSGARPQGAFSVDIDAFRALMAASALPKRGI